MILSEEEKEKNRNFSKKIFRTILILSLILSITFLFFSYELNENFLKKFSADKELEKSTIQKLDSIKYIFFLIGSIFYIFSIYFAIKKDFFIVLLGNNKKTIINISILLLTIFLLAFLAEFISKKYLLEKEKTAQPKTLNSDFYLLNEDGMRDNIYERDKPLGVYRIAAVGDSYTFGAGVENLENTFSKILERDLNSRNTTQKFEVLNFGISGYDLEDYERTIRNKVIQYEPDVIILGYVYNDFISTNMKILEFEKKPNWELPVLGFWLRSCSFAYYYFETRTNKLLENLNIKNKYSDIVEEKYSSEHDRKLTKEKMIEISSIAHENNVTLIIIVFPVPYDYSNYKFYFVEEFIHDFGKENQIITIEVIDRFKEYNMDKITVSEFDPHPNELGHKIISDKIIETMIQENIGGLKNAKKAVTSSPH